MLERPLAFLLRSLAVAGSLGVAAGACDSKRPVEIATVESAPLVEPSSLPAAEAESATVAKTPDDGPIVTARAPVEPPPVVVDPSTPAPPVLAVARLSSPPRSEVHDASGRWLATFTDGARTVRVASAAHSLVEAGVTASVTHGEKVRLLPAAFAGAVDEAWLARAAGDPNDHSIATGYLP